MNIIRIQYKISGLIITLVFLAGCKYYKNLLIEPVTNEALSTVAHYKPQIIVHLSDDSAYELRNIEVTVDTLKGIVGDKLLNLHESHKKSIRDKKKFINEDVLKTLHVYTSLNNLEELQSGIALNLITTVVIHEKDIAKSIYKSVGGLPGVIFLAVVVFPIGIAAIACACPQVESTDGQSAQFHGSLFPGSIFKSLKRKDYLILDNVLFDDGNLNLKVFNNLPETEYIDQLQVLEVDHTGYAFLGVDNENGLIAYNQSKGLANLRSDSLDENVYSVIYRDNLVYNFDNLDSPEDLNSITLAFDKNNFSEDAKLIIRGKQTEWLETVANYIFMNIGKSYDNWVKRKDHLSADKWIEKNEYQGVALNVYIKVNNNWKYVGSHHDAGTSSMRDLVMDIDLEQVSGSSIEVKLESAYKIWELDYVGITSDWSAYLSVSSVELQQIVDEGGNDISEIVASADDNYHVQEGAGSFINLRANGPLSTKTSSIVLQGTGYYHHIRDYEHKANLKFFMQLNNKLGIQDLSKALNLYKDLNVIARNSD